MKGPLSGIFGHFASSSENQSDDTRNDGWLRLGSGKRLVIRSAGTPNNVSERCCVRRMNGLGLSMREAGEAKEGYSGVRRTGSGSVAHMDRSAP